MEVKSTVCGPEVGLCPFSAFLYMAAWATAASLLRQGRGYFSERLRHDGDLASCIDGRSISLATIAYHEWSALQPKGSSPNMIKAYVPERANEWRIADSERIG